MKAIILAAGYATRLYPLTIDKPKPLLKVGRKTITDRLMEKIEGISSIDKVYIVTNKKFFPHFSEWVKKSRYTKKIEVVNDHTTTNENRLGAIGDMELVVRDRQVDDDIMVLGGDNLFEFDLNDFLKFAKGKNGNAVSLLDVGNKDEAKKYGIITLDSNSKVVEFVEKPKDPKSTLAAMCVYYFPKDKIKLLSKYLKLGLNKDAPGNYIAWLSKDDTVYGFKLDGEWFDIGDKKLLKLADELYKRREEKG